MKQSAYFKSDASLFLQDFCSSNYRYFNGYLLSRLLFFTNQLYLESNYMLFPFSNNQVDFCEASTCTSGNLDVLLMIVIPYFEIKGDSDICYSLLNSSSAKHILQIMTQCHR